MAKPAISYEGWRQIDIFMRKYLQMIDPLELTYPSGEVIKSSAAQSWLVDNLFDRSRWQRLPTARYSYRVMKALIHILTVAISDTEEDGISDKLMYHFTKELVTSQKGDLASAQEKCPVTYSAPRFDVAQTVTIFETPHLLASGGDTGHRTWPAALYLASYLCRGGKDYIENRSILELGAGLGFLSIFCARHLGAKHVLMTDGSDAVMALAQENVKENGVGQVVKTAILRWGESCVDDIIPQEQNGTDSTQYDVVLAADILYDPKDFPALISTLEQLFRRWPHLEVLVSTAVRTESTFKSFVDACRKKMKQTRGLDNYFRILPIAIRVEPEKEQIGFFHSTFDRIRLCIVTKPPEDISSDSSLGSTIDMLEKWT
ncbi:MAG: hypothetical protein L6R35_003624 [Caloplaca aegaea]|nr:MAG: hypothetical protein L6R35_003624 [Caloplaca aegaea]